MLKAYKYRLYPNKEQEIYLQKTFGCTRFIYNQMLADRIRNLCKTDELCNYSEDTMSGQTALNELCDYFLGKDWYVVDPLSNMQVNPIIVYEIERKYRKRI